MLRTPIISIQEAKKNLSRIVEEVAAGAEVLIAKAGKPMARLVPIQEKPARKRLGLLKGKIKVPDNFNAPLSDAVIAGFEGK
jgi:prevent-host-death family protein